MNQSKVLSTVPAHRIHLKRVATVIFLNYLAKGSQISYWAQSESVLNNQAQQPYGLQNLEFSSQIRVLPTSLVNAVENGTEFFVDLGPDTEADLN